MSKEKNMHFTHNPDNMRYLTWIPISKDESSGVISLPDWKVILVTDERFKWWNIIRELKERWIEVIIENAYEDIFDVLRKLFNKFKKQWINEIWIEWESLPYSKASRIKKLAQEVWLTLRTHDIVWPIEERRMIKTNTEVEHLQRACDITIQTLKMVIDEKLREWVSEEEIAYIIKEFANKNADWLWYDPIVSFWVNSYVCHHRPSETVLRKWDSIIFDISMRINGYCSDIARTLYTNNPSPQQIKAYNTVRYAKLMVEKKLHKWERNAWVLTAKTDKYLEKQGYKPMISALWHWVWLYIHEEIWIPNKKWEHIIQDWSVIAIEPSIYLPKKWIWVVLEDTIHVTRKWIRILSREMPLDIRY